MNRERVTFEKSVNSKLGFCTQLETPERMKKEKKIILVVITKII
jgi:hypothetical protein